MTKDKKENVDKLREFKTDKDETAVIGISLAITALSAAIVFSNDTSIILKIICLIIYILGGLSTGFLYFTFLINKIPDTMNLWLNKGGLGFKGTFWIIWYYIKLIFKQMFTLRGNSLSKIRELGYLTILAMLSILWLTFLIVTIESVIGLNIINVLQQ
ncbi:MAG: hypothetical protein N4A71_06200 [Carboxylicivirga sp.]|jgi:hypothetical protein|nr:hypothetical protein [Carboxylicivirga sp.]